MFNPILIEKFEEFKKATGKYKDLNINDITCKTKRIYSNDPNELVCIKRMGFTPKRDPEGDINWFTVANMNAINGLYIDNPNTKEKTTMALVKRAVDKKNTGKSVKLIPIKKGDILISFKLTVGVVKIYNSDKPAYCNEAIDILTVNKDINNKYIAYNCIIEYPKYGTQTNNGITLNDESKKEIKIMIPNPVDGYSSLEIQEAIVEFIDYQKAQTENLTSKMTLLEYDINKTARVILSKVFEMKDPFISEQFDNWAKLKSYNVTSSDFNFIPIYLSDTNYFKFVKGKNYYIKSYNTSHPGDIPLATGSVKNESIAYHVKAINEDDVVRINCVSFNKDGDTKVFYRDFPFAMDRHHVAILPEKNTNALYLYFSMLNILNHVQYEWGENTASVENMSTHKINIPNMINNYSSNELQEILSEFIGTFNIWKKKMLNLANSVQNKSNMFNKVFLNEVFKGGLDGE